MENTTTATERFFWLQVTTGTLHRSRTCGITSRTRYGHSKVMESDVRPSYRPCGKCNGGDRKATAAWGNESATESERGN